MYRRKIAVKRAFSFHFMTPLLLWLVVVLIVFSPISLFAVEGQLLTPDEEPLDDITITAFEYHRYLHPGNDSSIAQTTTDEEGVFTLPLNNEKSHMLFFHEGLQVFSQKIVEPGDSELSLIIDKTPVVTGDLYDEEGEGLESIVVGPLYLGEDFEKPYFTYTDRDGSFKFYNLPEKKYRFTLFVEGYRPALKEGEVPDRDVAVHLEKGEADITGTVVGSRTLQPIEDTPVILQHEDFHLSVKTDEEGQYVFSSLDPGTYTLYCAEYGKPWREKKEVELDEEGLANLILEYEQGVQIGGEINDYVSGEPVYQFSFKVVNAYPDPVEVTTDRQGVFFIPDLIFDEPLTFHSLDTEYRFIDEETGEIMERKEFPDVSEDEDMPHMEIYIQRAISLEGHIEAPESVLEEADLNIRTLSTGEESYIDFEDVKSDGSFTIHLFHPGDSYIYAYCKEGHYASPVEHISWESEEDIPSHLTLSLQQTGRVHLQAPQERNDIDNYRVRALCPESGNIEVARYTIEAGERKVLTGLPIENIHLHYSCAEGIYSGTQNVPMPFDRDVLARVEVEEKPYLFGHIYDAEGYPLQDVRITVEYDPEIETPYPGDFISQEDGSFRISPFSPDDCEIITFYHPEEGEYSLEAPFPLDEGIEITLEGPPALKGTIFRSRNQLFTGEMSFQYRHEEEEEFEEKTIEVKEGQFSVPGLEEGVNYVLMEDIHSDLSYQGTWEITDTTERLPDILLSPAQNFWGYIIDDDDRPLHEAEIILSSPLQEYSDITNKSGFFHFENLAGTEFDVRVEYTGHGPYEETYDLRELSLPYIIELTKAFRKIEGGIYIPDEMRFRLQILFEDPDDDEVYEADILNDEYEIDNIAIEEGELRVLTDGREVLTEHLRFDDEDTIEYHINLDQFITIAGELDVEPVFTAYPLIFQNVETNEEYEAFLRFGDYSYIVEVPGGIYDIRLGPMILESEVALESSKDTYDLSF